MLSVFVAETDFPGRSNSFESRVKEIHVWLSSAEKKFSLPLKIGDAEEMDKLEQHQAVS